MRPLILLLAMCLFSLPVQAEEEYRYDVYGTFTLTEVGTVSELNLGSNLPNALSDFVMEVVAAWRFEPVIENGDAMSIRVRFHFDIIGTPDGDEVIITLGEPSYLEVRDIRPVNTTSPMYPVEFVGTGVQATVVVEFRIGSDGRVTDVHTAQVGIVHGEHLRERVRRRIIQRFGRAAERAVSNWRFSPPPGGISAWGRYYIDFDRRSEWSSTTSEDNTDWYEMPAAPWRQGSGHRAAGLTTGGAGEYDLGDARVRRLLDAAPGG